VKAAANLRERRFPEQKKLLSPQRLGKAATSSVSKKDLKLPPIKGTKTLTLKQRSALKQSKGKQKTSPHAREYASATQQQEPVHDHQTDSDKEKSA
jgi:hypothetical protein